MSSGTESTVLDGKWNHRCLVKVKAQVMTRDDSTGMWVPLSGGGMSVVTLHRVLTPRVDSDGDDVSYVIQGLRIADRSMALNCELLSDFQYTSVNPTFHHWTSDSKRFGLTFQTSSDANAFQKSIQKLQQKMRLATGSNSHLDTEADEDIRVQLKTTSEESKEPEKNHSLMNEECSGFEQESTPKTNPRMPCINPQIFIKQPHSLPSQCVQLRNKSSSNVLSQVPPKSDGNSLSNVINQTAGITLGDYGFYVDVSTNGVDLDGNKGDAKDVRQKVEDLSNEADDLVYLSGSYVQFAKTDDPEKHEYCYPSLDSFKFLPYGTIPRSPYSEAQQIHLSTSVPVPIPIQSRRRWMRWKKSCVFDRQSPRPVRKSRCVYCGEFFTPEENRRGACKDAPDRILACIRTATCVCCQDAVLYHCRGEDEDVQVSDGMDCGFRHGSCHRRVITILICLVVPCLWCYLPLRACHRLGVLCRCCGPRHKAAR